ncbi:MAG: DoxX family protein [bacterium]
MNIVLWVLQVLLAFFMFAGGSYKVFMTDKLPSYPSIRALPNRAWVILGIFEIVCALGLLLPRKFIPNAIFIAACALALENILLALLHFYYAASPRTAAKLFSAQYPLVWVLLGAVLACIIAYGRHTRGA